MRILFVVLRLLIAGLILAAIIVTYHTSIGQWHDAGYADLTTLHVNFFSYFTIESNIIAVITLVIGVVLAFRTATDPQWFAVLRLSAFAYMTVTGIVYNLLLRGITVTGAGEGASWTNEVLHVVGPLFIIVDWLFAPGRKRMEWAAIRAVLIFPLAWVAYTLIRGPFVYDQVKGVQGWYPYPFLNPALSAEGYFSVAFYVLLIAAIFGLVAASGIWVTRRHERWPLPAPAAHT